MFNGSRGRLELEVVESDHVGPGAAGDGQGRVAARRRGRRRAGLVRACASAPFWRPPYEVEVPGYHRDGPRRRRRPDDSPCCSAAPTPVRRSARPRATERDGALALLTGLAANGSIATGAPVRVADLLDLRYGRS